MLYSLFTYTFTYGRLKEMNFLIILCTKYKFYGLKIFNMKNASYK